MNKSTREGTVYTITTDGHTTQVPGQITKYETPVYRTETWSIPESAQELADILRPGSPVRLGKLKGTVVSIDHDTGDVVVHMMENLSYERAIADHATAEI